MTGRILNRRELRAQADAAGPADAATVAGAPTGPKSARKPRAKAAAKTPRPRKPKVPPRMRARWGVFDNGMKQVAIFDYNQRAAADEKLADLLSRKKGIHFMQIVKDQMPAPAPVEAAVVA
jgi:hypothetical protein